jgi:tetratricopeptide (TPR) repeat protein
MALGASGVAAEAERAEWWSIDKQVVEQLLNRDAGQWARELGSPPQTAGAEELMRRFSVLNRAGHLRQARSLIDAMSDAKLQPSQLSTMADFLIGREDWSTARYFLERMPQAEPGWGYVLIKQWASTGNAKEIDAWLVERANANPSYWLRERLRFRSDQGTAGELVEELASEVHRQPQSAEAALAFLEATSMVNNRNIAWLGDVCRPASAYPSYRVGKALRSAPSAAIKLLEHSLEMPFTKQDAAQMAAVRAPMAMARPTSDPPLETQLRYATKQELLTALHAAGRSQRAQQVMEELARAQPDGLPPSGFDRLAGQVQAASGARVVQQRFQAAEKENEHNADYWLRRAAYFTGRKEHAEAIAAYEKAMQLAQPDPDKPGPLSAAVLRSSVLSSFVSFLENSHQTSAAVRLLEDELQAAAPEGLYAQRIIAVVLSGRDALLSKVDPERLWGYLAARPRWDHQEGRLLMRMMQLTGEQAPRSWQRAEGLARDGDPSRAAVLGWVMTRADASARAIAWLKSAWQRLEKPDERERVAFTLFEAYLDTNDWRSAEEMWPIARQRLTSNELPDWLGRIALSAAVAGDPADALRLWKQRTNLDRGSLKHLDEMLRAGQREPLLAFYHSLAEQDADCQSIEPVVARLRAASK